MTYENENKSEAPYQQSGARDAVQNLNLGDLFRPQDSCQNSSPTGIAGAILNEFVNTGNMVKGILPMVTVEPNVRAEFPSVVPQLDPAMLENLKKANPDGTILPERKLVALPPGETGNPNPFSGSGEAPIGKGDKPHADVPTAGAINAFSKLLRSIAGKGISSVGEHIDQHRYLHRLLDGFGVEK